jgi:hypothetical protein
MQRYGTGKGYIAARPVATVPGTVPKDFDAIGIKQTNT